MPTIIDSLLIQVGFDISKLIAGQKQIQATMTKVNAAVTKSGQNSGAAAASLTTLFSKMTAGLLALGAAIEVGKIADHLKDLFVGLQKINSQASNFAQAIGVSTSDLTRWQNATKAAGGSAEGMAQTIQGLVQDFAHWATLGPTESGIWLRTFVGDLRRFMDEKGNLKDTTGLLLAMGEAIKKMAPAQRLLFAQKTGIPLENINMLAQGRVELEKILAIIEKSGHATDEMGQHSRELLANWTLLMQRLGNFANILADKISPILNWPLKVLNNLIGGGNVPASFTGPPGSVPAAPSAQVKAKEGAGNLPLGLYGITQSIQNEIPGFNRFTSFQDTFHQGRQSKHNEGLAFDFTLTNDQRAAEITKAINEKFASMGIDAKALDEYSKQSAGATGGHIHVQFSNQEALSKYNNNSAGNTFHIENLSVYADDPKKLTQETIRQAGGIMAARRRANAVPAQSAVQ